MFQVRPIGEEDIPFLWEMLYESLYVPEGGCPFPRDVIHEPSLSKYVEGWGRIGDYGYIAIDAQGERVGSVIMRFFKESNQGYGYVNEETPELNIAIIDAYRGKGIGTLLLESILEYGKAKQLPAISLSVDPNNYAVKLYERYGFHEIGMVDTSITMILELTNEQRG
ncbi:histone acetyltransferase [Paenibacillus selenitireducens]|uniref:Histone acetyltransferase n=1 Tax=Paenibacillus selenitireducens TaxID=1324314 RepID=A0A1T2X6R3_9BACL|nr:GNAT family N-acetyltransferase [Paenibacillus selenitireducens]OPA75283.1 histone acetyltransferase [Paenibacillus selenitireducens]